MNYGDDRPVDQVQSGAKLLSPIIKRIDYQKG